MRILLLIHYEVRQEVSAFERGAKDLIAKNRTDLRRSFRAWVSEFKPNAKLYHDKCKVFVRHARCHLRRQKSGVAMS